MKKYIYDFTDGDKDDGDDEDDDGGVIHLNRLQLNFKLEKRDQSSWIDIYMKIATANEMSWKNITRGCW